MKRVIIPVAAFIAGMAIVPSVFADGAEGGPADPLKAWGANIAPCLSAEKNDTCTLADDADLNFSSTVKAEVKKDMVLNLNGKTVTLASGWGGITIKDDASLTITNGAIVDNSNNTAINVEDGGSLTIDVDAEVGVEAGAHSHVILNTGRTLIGSIKMSGDKPNTFGNYDGTAATAEINGTLKGAYTQTARVNATINGKIEANGNAADITGEGTLILNHATLTSVSGAPVVIRGAKGTVAINNCSVLTAQQASQAALYIAANADVTSLTINNSTLKNAEGSVIDGGADSKIATVTINGSRFEAKAETAVKTGSTVFTKAVYDGRTLADGENVLTVAKGAWGAETVVCDAPVDTDGDADKGEESENPNTADTIATYLTIATVALLGLGATAFVAKKSNR